MRIRGSLGVFVDEDGVPWRGVRFGGDEPPTGRYPTLRGGEHEGNKQVHAAARARLAGKDYEHEDLAAQIDALAADLENKDEKDHAAAIRFVGRAFAPALVRR